MKSTKLYHSVPTGEQGPQDPRRCARSRVAALGARRLAGLDAGTENWKTVTKRATPDLGEREGEG